MMSLVRLLGFTTLSCGCVTGKYREVATHREVMYVEEKGSECGHARIGAITRWPPRGSARRRVVADRPRQLAARHDKKFPRRQTKFCRLPTIGS